MAASHGSLPFQEQIDYFRGKVQLPTRSWSDIYASEHDWAFVVAGATRRNLLADLHGAVQQAIEEGRTLDQFRQDFDEIVAKHGWEYNGGRGWRTRVIYETNMRQSYRAGREAQMADPELRKRRPYGWYRHGDSKEPREQHLEWHDLVLLLSDPWWLTHTPINGWGCQCDKFMLSERDVKRLGLKVSDTAPAVEYEDRVIGQNSPNGPRTVRVPVGIDPGFEYTPGLSRLNSAVPEPYDTLPEPSDGAKSSATGAGLPNRRAVSPLPEPQSAPADRLLPEGLEDSEYLRRFLGEFGADENKPSIFRDVLDEALVIGRGMFTQSKTGQLKISKRGHARELLLLADALKHPDEIWVRLEWMYALGKSVVRRRYITRFNVEGQRVPALAVFEVGSDGWAGVTTFSPDANNQEYLERLRMGVRLYRRPDK